MFNQTFVSLYFLSNKLSVIQLDSKKKKVQKYASLDLPQGLIKGGVVDDKLALANILKGAWSKIHLKEKTAGIILPEFSTFTKMLTIPKLQLSELDEAVRWQAQEYLPSPLTEMIMDWKIVNNKDKEYEILIVAIDKKTLFDYVEAVEKADLFPLAVVIPSLCLSRLTSSDNKENCLIIYKNYGESIIILAQGDKIFGTSVLRNQDVKSVVATAVKMISHYKEFNADKVFIGGTETDETLQRELQKIINKEISFLKPKISGLSDTQLQEYLIPISMQLKDLSEPSDPFTINLLPNLLVEKYKKARLKLQIWSLTLTVTLFVWISFLITLGAYLLMVQQVSDLKDSKTRGGSLMVERQEAIKDVKYINEFAEKILKIKKITTPPQKVLNDINGAKPAGITISIYKLDLDIGKIDLGVVAATRADLLQFKDNLETNPNVGSVIIPISSFESEVNQEFKLSFDFLPITENIPAKK